MKLIIVIFALLVSLGCNKAESDKLSSQNSESSTEDSEVKQVENKETVKNYKKGEPIELYDLVNMFIPDEGKSFNCPNVEEIDVTVNGNSFKSPWFIFCDENRKYISLGYVWSNYYEEEAFGGVDFETMTSINFLFPNNNFSSKELKKGGSGGYSGAHAIYEIDIPTKQRIWIQTSGDAGNKQSAFSVEIFLNESELKQSIYY